MKSSKKPFTICHMMMSLDGRIDCGMTSKIAGVIEYYETLDALNVDSMLSGRVTAAIEMAVPGKFTVKSTKILGKESFSKKRAGGYQIVTDTHGTLLWNDDRNSDSPLLIVTAENASQEYFDYLDAQGISWIACGKDRIDLNRASEILFSEFDVKRLAVVGGGTINAAFLDAGLLDEISILLGPAIDGRKGMTATFDGLSADREPFTLKLLSATPYADGALWLRYAV